MSVRPRQWAEIDRLVFDLVALAEEVLAEEDHHWNTAALRCLPLHPAQAGLALESRPTQREQQKPWGSSGCGSEWGGLDIVGGHGRIQGGEQIMERTVEGSCSRLQESELPHGFCCSRLTDRAGSRFVNEGRTAMSVETLVEHFSALEDPRCTGKVEHRLIDILVIAVCAVIACAVRLGLPATANPLKPKPGLAPK
jgi:hypothetical protein